MHVSCCLYRLSSDLFPWGDSGKYKLEELPDLPEIAQALAEVGALARLYQQRLTAHPSEFVKMAAQKEDIVWKSIFDLEVHARVGTAGLRCRGAQPHVVVLPCTCSAMLLTWREMATAGVLALLCYGTVHFLFSSMRGQV